MSGIGHNGGPTLEPGAAWRRHCWGRARARLFPTLPVEVVRLRVRRAAELGLDYRTYSGVRAATGHDLVAFLFSTNALGLIAPGDRLRDAVAAKLTSLAEVPTLIAAHPPLDPEAARAVVAADAAPPAAAIRAPGLAQRWRATRAALLGLAARVGAPADRVLVIGVNALERDWSEAARMAGFLRADHYFGAG
ncbi:MAG: hypothetical protein ACKVPY_12745 [Paracoccaceae bacterium]